MTQVSFTERDVALDSGTLRVRVGGSGRPLVHLHSAAGPRVSPVVSRLAGQHTVHQPFLPGFDGTPRHAGVTSVTGLADLVAAYIRQELDGKCDVVAESFGGWVALWLAARVDHARLTYVYGAAHALEFDAPDRVGTIAADFLERGESFLVRDETAARG